MSIDYSCNLCLCSSVWHENQLAETWNVLEISHRSLSCSTDGNVGRSSRAAQMSLSSATSCVPFRGVLTGSYSATWGWSVQDSRGPSWDLLAAEQNKRGAILIRCLIYEQVLLNGSTLSPTSCPWDWAQTTRGKLISAVWNVPLKAQIDCRTLLQPYRWFIDWD